MGHSFSKTIDSKHDLSISIEFWYRELWPMWPNLNRKFHIDSVCVFIIFFLFNFVYSYLKANLSSETHNFYTNFFNHTARGEFYIFNTLVVDVRGLLKWKLWYWDFQSLWIFLYEFGSIAYRCNCVLEQHFCSVFFSLSFWYLCVCDCDLDCGCVCVLTV